MRSDPTRTSQGFFGLRLVDFCTSAAARLRLSLQPGVQVLQQHRISVTADYVTPRQNVAGDPIGFRVVTLFDRSCRMCR